MNEPDARNNRFNGTVATFYNPITQVDTREWDSIREFDGPYHPLLGEYRCDDLAVVRQQLHWMRRAGVDVIIYDVYGFRTWSITDLPKDKTLPLIVEELSHQQNESRQLKLIIWLEKWDANPSVEEYRYGLRHVWEKLADHEFYFHYCSAPLVVTYINGESIAIETIEKENDFFTMRRIRPFRTDVWSYIEESPQTLHPEWMPVNPGFDPYLEAAYREKYVAKKEVDLAAIQQHGKTAASRREDGRFFERQLLRAREGNPHIIFVSGWNDWQCCLQIEPAVEYGFKYVDMAACLLGREVETRPYR